MVLVVENYEILGRQPLEHRANRRLQVVKEQRLVSGGEVLSYGVDGYRRRIVRSVYVRTVYDDGNALAEALLGDQVPDVVHGGEDEAAVGGQQKIFGTPARLKLFENELIKKSELANVCLLEVFQC